ncbi:5162_t:CDS:2, partial [Ambispora leptoticha]
YFAKDYYSKEKAKNKTLRTQILEEHHDIPIFGHLEIDKTYKYLQRSYY